MSGQPSSLVNHPARVSFTVRRPSPLSSRQSSAGPESNPSNGTSTPFKIPAQPVAASPLKVSNGVDSFSRDEEEVDSSDEDQETDELVSGFDSMGVQRVKPVKKTNDGPLVIPLLANRDWRSMARAKQAAKGYVPESARAVTGPDGSQGGLGTRDTINSGPQLSGLIKPVAVKSDPYATIPDFPMPPEQDVKMEDGTDELVKVEDLDEDARALQALLQGPSGHDIPTIAPIVAVENEDDVYKRDMSSLPDVASMDDYARVPVEQFGAAMLRGMGWKPPSAKGEDEPWVPARRPLLLGLGAKARPADVADAKSNPGRRKEDRRYIPLVKRESAGASRASSRSRSPPAGGRGERDRERRDDKPYRSDRDRDSRGGKTRDSRDERVKDYRSERDSDRDRDRRGDRDGERDSSRRRERDDRKEDGTRREREPYERSTSRR